jgi:hypothetical protein
MDEPPPRRRRFPRKREEELSPEELEAQAGSALPDREALSIVQGDVSIPVDPGVAADVLLDQEDEEASRAADPPADADQED